MVTLSQILDKTNFITINSEPYSIFIDHIEKVHFTNVNNENEYFHLNLNQEPTDYCEGLFKFQIPYTDKCISIQFFAVVPLVLETIQTN